MTAYRMFVYLPVAFWSDGISFDWCSVSSFHSVSHVSPESREKKVGDKQGTASHPLRPSLNKKMTNCNLLLSLQFRLPVQCMSQGWEVELTCRFPLLEESTEERRMGRSLSFFHSPAARFFLSSLLFSARVEVHLEFIGRNGIPACIGSCRGERDDDDVSCKRRSDSRCKKKKKKEKEREKCNDPLRVQSS